MLPLVLILGLFMAIEYARHREATLGNLSFVAAQTAQVIENSLQHEMLSHNLEGIRHMLDGIGEDKKIRAIYMMDTTGRIAFAPRGVEVGRQLDNRDPTCQPCHQLPATMRPIRTFQEALCNVARHAGASHVRMSLAACDGEFEGEIVDDGRGFDPQTIRPDGHSGRGLGLLGMQERVAQCGGTLEIVSRPGAGTRLRIKIPLPEAASD